MNPNDAKKMILTTDFTLDKILDYIEGSVTVGALDTEQQTVPHDLKYNPLPIISWSHTPGFDTSYENGATSGGFPDTTLFDLGANSSSFQLFALNNTASSKTFYWRVYTLPRHDEDMDINPTASVSQNTFLINSDRNYTKLFLAGSVISSTPIYHGLGYYPQVMGWRTIISDSLTYPMTQGFVYVTPELGEASMEVTTDEIIIGMGDSVAEVSYRIYLDD